MSESIDTVIVGGGQAALAVSYYLAQSKIEGSLGTLDFTSLVCPRFIVRNRAFFSAWEMMRRLSALIWQRASRNRWHPTKKR